MAISIRSFLFCVCSLTLSVSMKADWTMIEALPVGAYTKALASSGTTLLAATDGAGVFTSSDFGKNWSPSNNGLTDLHVSNLISHQGYVYALSSECFASSNNGANWSVLKTKDGNKISLLWKNSKSLFAFSGATNGMYRSNDAGQTWDSLSIGLANGSFLVGNDMLCYIGRTAQFALKLAVSLDNGSTWTLNDASGMPQFAASYAFVSNRILIGGDMNGVTKSDDDGKTWSESNEGMTKGVVGCMLSIDNTVFAGVNDIAVYKSENNGDTWTDVSQGYGTSRAFSQLLFHNGKMFAVLLSGDVYRRDVKELVSDVEQTPAHPVDLSIDKAYPNPVSEVQTITIHSVLEQAVELDVVDVHGHVVTQVYQGLTGIGDLNIQWNCSNLSSGSYQLRLRSSSPNGNGSYIQNLPVAVIR